MGYDKFIYLDDGILCKAKDPYPRVNQRIIYPLFCHRIAFCQTQDFFPVCEFFSGQKHHPNFSVPFPPFRSFFLVLNERTSLYSHCFEYNLIPFLWFQHFNLSGGRTFQTYFSSAVLLMTELLFSSLPMIISLKHPGSYFLPVTIF